MRERTRPLIAGCLLAACVVVAFLAPIPTPTEFRALAASAGPAMPLVVFGVYAVCAALPLPRTAFSLASGLLLGNALGIVVAVGATLTAASLGFLLARTLGADLLGRHSHRESIRAVDARISGGGVIGITSLRLIPVIPFAPLSYFCGVTSIRMHPYLLGTLLGSLPGTAAVVILGDALTGATPPALVAWYSAFALVGAVGVYWMVRRGRTGEARVTPEHAVVGTIGPQEPRQYTRLGS